MVAKWWLVMIAVISVWGWNSALVFADDAPTTAPAGAAVAADGSTPQGIMLVFIRALETGDVNAAVGACVIRTEEDKEMLTAVTAATQAHAQLRLAMKLKWADGAPKPEMQVGGLSRVFSEYDFSEPTVTEAGDTATAELRNKRGTIGLVKTQDGWRISLAACMKDYSGYKPSDVVKSFGECEAKAIKLTERVMADEFESFDAFKQVLDKEEKEAAEKERNRKRGGL